MINRHGGGVRLFIIMVGIPGSGKTTVHKRIFPHARIICPDDAIGYTKENPWTPHAAKEAWLNTDRAIKTLLNAETAPGLVLLDATNVDPRRRQKYIRIARKAGVATAALYCKVSEEICRKRNDARDEFRRVPDEAMVRMANRLKKPELDEGFSFIIKVNNEGEFDTSASVEARIDDEAHKLVDFIFKSAKNYKEKKNVEDCHI